MEKRKLPDMTGPIWFDGTSINEAVFCDEYLKTHKIIYANRAFFTPDGRVTDEIELRGEIYEQLKCCAVNNLPRKITNILEVLKLAAHVEDFIPETDRIHLENGTLYLDGRFTEGRPDIVASRLPVAFHPDAPKPKRWLAFLEGLLYPEDIPTLQKFIGYCLIPSNKGQRMMVIKGNGGEGKSQIGSVLGALFGSSMKDGSIGKISENRFARADLEHILLCVDDDMRMEALRQTNYVKSIVTAQGKMDLERGESASQTGRTHIPPRLYKEAVHLNQMRSKIMKLMADTNLLNKRVKMEELEALLDQYIPATEAMRTKLKKYDRAYKEMAGENEALEAELKTAKEVGKEKIANRLKYSRMEQELNELVDQIPPEIVTAYKRGQSKTRTRNREECL